MKANELRIGNWIRTKQTNKEFQFKATQMMVEPIIESNYEGIPLTEEWLEKFGFEKKIYSGDEGIRFEYILKIDKYSTLIIQDDFSFGIEDIKRDEGVCFENDIIASVHQLQNLYFALCGKELNIKE